MLLLFFVPYSSPPILSPLHQYYPTILSAVAGSSEGDRILVHPGVYNESVVLDKPVSLIGAGEWKDHPIIIVIQVVTIVVDLYCTRFVTQAQICHEHMWRSHSWRVHTSFKPLVVFSLLLFCCSLLAEQTVCCVLQKPHKPQQQCVFVEPTSMV